MRGFKWSGPVSGGRVGAFRVPFTPLAAAEADATCYIHTAQSCPRGPSVSHSTATFDGRCAGWTESAWYRIGGDWPYKRMDELVQDLVSDLEKTSEHTQKYADFEDEASHNSTSYLLMRQARKRRVGRRRMDIEHRIWEFGQCMSDVSESSLEGTIHDYTENNNCNDSDDHLSVAKRLSSLNVTAIRRKRQSWHESDSITDSNLIGRSLQRRNMVKRMAIDSPAEVSNTLHPLTQGNVPAASPERSQVQISQLHFHFQVQDISKDKIIKPKRLQVPDEGVGVESEEICNTNRDKMEYEEQKVSDDSMSDRLLRLSIGLPIWRQVVVFKYNCRV